MDTDLPPLRRYPTRPYANTRKDGPSITACSGLLGKDGLQWGAAKVTTRYWQKNHAELLALPDDECYEQSRRWFKGVWDGSAAMGNLVHAANQAWVHGDEFNVTDEVHRLANLVKYRKSDGRSYDAGVRYWRDREDEVAEEAEGYIDALEKFWRWQQPKPIGAEEIVRWAADPDLRYIGQRDFTCYLGNERWLIELKSAGEDKTEGKSDPCSYLYLDSWRPQLAAQRFAEEIVFYDFDHNDPNGKAVECGTHPNYRIDHVGVLYLVGGNRRGEYEFYEVSAGEEEFDIFLRLRSLQPWSSGEWKKPAPRRLFERVSTWDDDPFEGVA